MNTTHDVQSLRSFLDRKKGRIENLKQQIKEKSLEKRKTQRSLRLNEKAQIVIQEVAKITKEKLKYHLSDISSLAMSSIFPDPYNVVFDFVSKRGKIETDIWFEKEGSHIQPFSTGGGPVDIASMSIRFSCWTLQIPKTRPIIFLDEPLKFVSKDYINKAGNVIKEVSDRLGLQIIMITHIPELINVADRIITTKLKKGITHIEIE